MTRLKQWRLVVTGLCLVALVLLAVVVPAGCCLLLAALVPLGLLADTGRLQASSDETAYVPSPLSIVFPPSAGRAPPSLA